MRLRRRDRPGRRARLRPVGGRRAVHQPHDRQAPRARSSGLTRSPRSGPAITAVFRDYGYRRLRHRARLKFLIADWGPEKFREVLEKEYLGYALPDGPAPAAAQRRQARPCRRAPAAGRAVLRRVRPRVGRMSGTSLARVADLAARVRQRAGPDDHRAEDGHPRRAGGQGGRRLPPSSTRPDLPATPSVFRRHTMACTGIEFCKLAIVETKARATQAIAELERRLPGFTEPVTINVNGCPNSCARIQTADIGLKGSLVIGPDGAGRPRDSRSTWAAPWPGATARAPDSAGRSGPEDHRGGPAGLPGAGSAPLPGGPGRGRDLRRVGQPG